MQQTIKNNLILENATTQQFKVIANMQSGTQHLFFSYLGNQPITQATIDQTLQVMVNAVESDESQLDEAHLAYAKEKDWLW
jgi:hypothetical protein